MIIKIYLTIHPDEQLTFSNAPQIVEGGRTYSFELDLPSPIPKIKIDADKIHEVIEIPDDATVKEAHEGNGIYRIPPAKVLDAKGNEVTH